MADTSPADPDIVRDLRGALYWLPQPVMLITAAAGGRQNVMIAVRGMHYLDPPNPSIVIGVANHSLTGDLIDDSGEFGVNLLAADQADLLLRGREQSRVSSEEVDKFAAYGVETFAGEVIGAPLVRGCTCNFECTVRHRVDLGDGYRLVVGEIVAIHGVPSRGPMAMYRQAGYGLETPIPGTSR
jgi:flavin reductase (DIM6/NTAB) family NADH-FMN oxidoreductase RutF